MELLASTWTTEQVGDVLEWLELIYQLAVVLAGLGFMGLGWCCYGALTSRKRRWW